MYTDVTETCRSHQPPFTLESPTCLTRSGGPQALGSSCGSMNLLSSEEIWSGGAVLDGTGEMERGQQPRSLPGGFRMNLEGVAARGGAAGTESWQEAEEGGSYPQIAI
ncbi:Reduced Folate Transporter [Manis pentadactyla]|nr:Reduced Folate Transporter [Manis pentadactyla]